MPLFRASHAHRRNVARAVIHLDGHLSIKSRRTAVAHEYGAAAFAAHNGHTTASVTLNVRAQLASATDALDAFD